MYAIHFIRNLFLSLLYIYIYVYSFIAAHIYMDVVASVLKIKGDLKEAFGVIMFLKNVC